MKALIAMSGGVDSSVAAYLIKNQGFDVMGAMMLLYQNEDSLSTYSKTCGSTEDAEDARKIAQKLEISFEIFDFREQFRQSVMQDFVESYENGETPNPCIQCNKHMKFGCLLNKAKELGCEKLVTGHYALVEQKGERYLLKKGADVSKDQSYVLYSLTQEQLSHMIFPLGGYSKAQIRGIAEENGFINSQKPDSQDICFVPDGDYASVISKLTNKTYPEGYFVDTKGNILGRHKGIIRYTIGQRKGLGLSLKAPMYVLEKRMNDNTVVLADNNELFKKELDVKDFNYILFDDPQKPFRAKVKIRYNQPEQWATVTPTGKDTVHIVFDQPQRAIAKGQSAVAYQDEYVIGGGIIV